MCLIVFAYRKHRDYPFIFAANRDERHERPTRKAHFWEDNPEILAGRDEVASGTWCGVTRGGRWAALSNFRDPAAHRSDAPSRGQLVAGFLDDRRPPGKHLEELEEKASAYNGFNLVVGDLVNDELYYFSNRAGPPQQLEPGIHGLSNHLLNTPWPKVEWSKNKLADVINSSTAAPPREAQLFEILQSTERPPDEELPDTGLSLEIERLVAAPFIVSPTYGTRSSTVVTLDGAMTLRFVEKTYSPAGEVVDTVSFEWNI